MFVYYITSQLKLKTVNIIPYYWINCIHCIIVILIETVCVIGLDYTEHIPSIECVTHANSHESKTTFVYYITLYN